MKGIRPCGISWNSFVSPGPTNHDTIPQSIPAWGCDCIPLMLKSRIMICLVPTMRPGFYIHTYGEYHWAT